MTAQFLTKWLTIHNSILVCSALESGGPGGARSPPGILGLSYGNTGCRVFKRGVQNWKDFCLKSNLPKGNS